jgi:hypothetical protein
MFCDDELEAARLRHRAAARRAPLRRGRHGRGGDRGRVDRGSVDGVGGMGSGLRRVDVFSWPRRLRGPPAGPLPPADARRRTRDLSEDGPPFGLDGSPPGWRPCCAGPSRATARPATIRPPLSCGSGGVRRDGRLPDSVAVLDFQNLSLSPEDAWIRAASETSARISRRSTVSPSFSGLGGEGARGARWRLAGRSSSATRSATAGCSPCIPASGEPPGHVAAHQRVSTRSVVATEGGRLGGSS